MKGICECCWRAVVCGTVLRCLFSLFLGVGVEEGGRSMGREGRRSTFSLSGRVYEDG